MDSWTYNGKVIVKIVANTINNQTDELVTLNSWLVLVNGSICICIDEQEQLIVKSLYCTVNGLINDIWWSAFRVFVTVYKRFVSSY